MFCQYVRLKSFCKKNKEFKIALMTSFILLLKVTKLYNDYAKVISKAVY